MPAPTDDVLLRAAMQGDLDSFGEMVERYEGTVYSTCYRILAIREDAQDVAQETFVRAYRHLNRFEPQRPFGPWVRRIAANLSLNLLRRRHALEPLDDERLTSSQSFLHPEDILVSKQASERVYRQLMELPDHYRVVIVLRHYLEMSYAEMAAELGLPLSTVKSNLYRARKKLAESMVADG